MEYSCNKYAHSICLLQNMQRIDLKGMIHEIFDPYFSHINKQNRFRELSCFCKDIRLQNSKFAIQGLFADIVSALFSNSVKIKKFDYNVQNSCVRGVDKILAFQPFSTFQNITIGSVLFSLDCFFNVSERPSKYIVDVCVVVVNDYVGTFPRSHSQLCCHYVTVIF